MEPGPGGDPIRNPMVLPTGKNIHALDPQSIPTQAALKSARIVVERCACHLQFLHMSVHWAAMQCTLLACPPSDKVQLRAALRGSATQQAPLSM